MIWLHSRTTDKTTCSVNFSNQAVFTSLHSPLAYPINCVYCMQDKNKTNVSMITQSSFFSFSFSFFPFRLQIPYFKNGMYVFLIHFVVSSWNLIQCTKIYFQDFLPLKNIPTKYTSFQLQNASKLISLTISLYKVMWSGRFHLIFYKQKYKCSLPLSLSQNVWTAWTMVQSR